MKTKLATAVCVLAITFGGVTSSRAANDRDALVIVADALVIRPGCLVATAIGSALFVFTLPISAISKSVKRTANTLVIKPARATFTRPLGAVEELADY